MRRGLSVSVSNLRRGSSSSADVSGGRAECQSLQL